MTRSKSLREISAIEADCIKAGLDSPTTHQVVFMHNLYTMAADKGVSVKGAFGEVQDTITALFVLRGKASVPAYVGFDGFRAYCSLSDPETFDKVKELYGKHVPSHLKISDRFLPAD